MRLALFVNRQKRTCCFIFIQSLQKLLHLHGKTPGLLHVTSGESVAVGCSAAEQHAELVNAGKSPHVGLQ